MTIFERNLVAHLELFSTLRSINDDVIRAGRAIAEALRAGGKVMFCGNGGSAADSQHLAAEFTGRFIFDRIPLAGLALSTDSSALTCISNDYGFEHVFARQLQALGKAGDCLVGISTSGDSRNIVNAFAHAKSLGITTIGLLGRDGGQLAPMSDVAIVVPSNTTARIQEAHIMIGHSLCGMVEEALVPPA